MAVQVIYGILWVLALLFCLRVSFGLFMWGIVTDNGKLSVLFLWAVVSLIFYHFLTTYFPS